MPRVGRVRTRTTPFYYGTLTGYFFSSPISRNNLDSYNPSIYGLTEEDCTDSVGRPVTPSSLVLHKRDRSGLIPVNGSWSAPPFRLLSASNYLMDGQRSFKTAHNSIPGVPSASADMSRLLARTNPSRPDYVPLTLLQDIVDIPRQLKDVGRLIKSPASILKPREVANQYLGIQFGWLPLFRDVQDLLDLSGHIHRRVGELHRLYSSNGLRRRIRLGQWGSNTQSTQFLNSNEFVCTATRSIQTNISRWGTVRWLPSVPLPKYNPSDAEILRQAKKVSLGLTVESTLKGAWDLIPWTWLINWSTNISDFALQYSNTVPALPSSPCVMTKTESVISDTSISLPVGMTGGGGFETYVTKERYVGSGTLGVTLPFIDSGRLSILSALFVQRFKR